jgi:16S rRNA G1207 methylase RsmC
MNRFEQMRKQAAEPIQIVTAPLLYPTPDWLADRMAQELGASQFHLILEPSAGLGALIDAVTYGNKYGHDITAIDESWSLVKHLRSKYPEYRVHHMDFLNFTHVEKFDRIIMNPPFNGGADIKHINHALTLLKPGGRLVAICADGSRQNEKLKPLADHWEKLPPGAFQSAGTNVNTVLMIINKEL